MPLMVGTASHSRCDFPRLSMSPKPLAKYVYASCVTKIVCIMSRI